MNLRRLRSLAGALRPIVGAAVLAAAVAAPPPSADRDASPRAGDRISGPSTPGAVPPAPGLRAWAPVTDGVSDGPDPTIRRGHEGPETSVRGEGPRAVAGRVRGARMVRPAHATAQARLRAGSSIHATTLPPPGRLRSGRPI